MKRLLYIFMMSAFVLSFTMLNAAWSAESRDEKSLGKEATEINTTAGSDHGQKVVVGRLETEFGVTDSQIQSLRDQKLGYGEIAIVFSLAQKLPGGITDANISQVMTLREGPPTLGWGEVAKKLDLNLGSTISQVMSVNKDTEREMHGFSDKGKMEQHQERQGEMMEHGGMGAGGMSHGKGR